MNFPPRARVSISLAGQLRRARVVSRIDCGSKVIGSDARDVGSRSEAESAYVVAVTSGPDRGRRITIHGSALTAHTDQTNHNTTKGE